MPRVFPCLAHRGHSQAWSHPKPCTASAAVLARAFTCKGAPTFAVSPCCCYTHRLSMG